MMVEAIHQSAGHFRVWNHGPSRLQTLLEMSSKAAAASLLTTVLVAVDSATNYRHPVHILPSPSGSYIVYLAAK